MSDVDKTLQGQRDEIARLREECASLRGALHEARRAARSQRDTATFILPDGIQIAYACFVDIDAVFTLSAPLPGRYSLHDKAPTELQIDRADSAGLVLKEPRHGRYGAGSSIGWLIQRVECPTPNVTVALGRFSVEQPLQTLSGRRLVEGDDLAVPIAVPWGLAFQVIVEVDRPVDLRVTISGLRRN